MARQYSNPTAAFSLVHRSVCVVFALFVSCSPHVISIRCPISHAHDANKQRRKKNIREFTRHQILKSKARATINFDKENGTYMQ